uniref:Ig-like domain-containing protein n=1 Tax=Petromyzon marinus TaxID=7757 RepID=S4RQF2_PETMA
LQIGTCVLKNGHPKPSSVTWYKSEIPILQGEDHRDNVTETVTEDSGKWTVRSTLRYKPRIHDHGSQFFCKASYHIPGESISMVSSKATLTLMFPPASVFITVEPQHGNVQEDGNATLTCNANANPPPSYTFYSASMPDTNKPITKGVNGNQLHLARITRSQSGKYRCQ